MDKLVTQNVVISGGSIGAPLVLFSSDVKLSFSPDIMRVVSINFVESGAANEVYLVQSNLIPEPLGVAIDYPGVTGMGLEFLMHRRSIQGTYSFELINSVTKAPVTPNGKLVICIEFVQYTGKK